MCEFIIFYNHAKSLNRSLIKNILVPLFQNIFIAFLIFSVVTRDKNRYWKIQKKSSCLKLTVLNFSNLC